MIVAQNNVLFCEIKKDSPNEFLITNCLNENKFKVVNNTLINLTNSNQYRFVYKKHSSSSKLFLIKEPNDTLAILSNSLNAKDTASQVIKCYLTNTGWKYMNSEEIVICEIIHSWNNSAWYFKIRDTNCFFENEAISTIVFMSLHKLADDFEVSINNTSSLFCSFCFTMLNERL